jgi:hypothetical protein
VKTNGSVTSVTDGGKWSDTHPGSFTPRESAQRIHWIRGLVGPRVNKLARNGSVITLLPKYSKLPSPDLFYGPVTS